MQTKCSVFRTTSSVCVHAHPLAHPYPLAHPLAHQKKTNIQALDLIAGRRQASEAI